MDPARARILIQEWSVLLTEAEQMLAAMEDAGLTSAESGVNLAEVRVQAGQLREAFQEQTDFVESLERIGEFGRYMRTAHGKEWARKLTAAVQDLRTYLVATKGQCPRPAPAGETRK
jgi:hypothetical protein